jgi:probable rRNA maturation factor
MNIEITNLTKKKIPKFPLKEIKERVLGKNYQLSVVFARQELMRKLNKKYRGKNKATDVLSFPLSKKSGEIFINLKNTKNKKEILFSFIHSLLHCRGLKHGEKMKKGELKYLKEFKKYG